MIEVERLSYRYPGRAEPALREVSLKVHRGELLLILGPNGSGKTTLAKLLAGLLRPTAGSVQIDGRVGFLFQNAAVGVLGSTVKNDVALGLGGLGLTSREVERRVRAMLELFELEGLADRSPEELSGGELQRLALAGLLAPDPDYLILDEPSAQLEWKTWRGLVELLRELKREGKGIVLISQDAELLELADRAAFLNRGELLAWGPPQELLQNGGGALFERAGLLPPQSLELYWHLRERLPLGRELPLGPSPLAAQLRGAISRSSLSLRSTLTSTSTLNLNLSSPPPGSPTLGRGEDGIGDGNTDTEGEERAAPLLEAQGLHFRYSEDGPPALEGISLAIAEGEVVGLTGPAGSGKTTLVQLMSGLLRPSAGEVLFRGRVISKIRASELCCRVGLVFQNPLHQLFADDVLTELMSALGELGLPQEEQLRRARVASEAVGLELESIGRRSPFSLSQGEQVRLAIATVLALEPEVLILDETLSSLDPLARRGLLERLLQLREREGRRLTLVIVSHRLGELLPWLDRVFILEGGQLVAAGSPRELLSHPLIWPPPVAQVLWALGLPGALTVEEALPQLQSALGSPIL